MMAINEMTMSEKQTQHKKIIEYLSQGNVLTPLEAIGVAGTMKLATLRRWVSPKRGRGPSLLQFVKIW